MAAEPEASMAHLNLEDGALEKPSRGGGRRGGRGGGRSGGGGGREMQVSKALSKLLRHQAENAGITLDEEGFAPLDKVLQWGPIKSLKASLEEIQAVVENNEKKRFTLKPNPETNPSLSTESTSTADYLIRANQGHSIKVEAASLFTPLTMESGNVPDKVVHGTYFAFWPAIVESGGLKPMNRGHIHCADKTLEEGAVSGMRRDAELMIEIDIEASLKEGVTWWRSDNGVILTDGGEGGVLSTKFFKLVSSRKADVGVLWENGEKKANLPDGLKISVPFGKGGRGAGGGRGRGRGRGGGRGGRGRGETSTTES